MSICGSVFDIEQNGTIVKRVDKTLLSINPANPDSDKLVHGSSVVVHSVLFPNPAFAYL